MLALGFMNSVFYHHLETKTIVFAPKRLDSGIFVVILQAYYRFVPDKTC